MFLLKIKIWFLENKCYLNLNLKWYLIPQNTNKSWSFMIRLYKKDLHRVKKIQLAFNQISWLHEDTFYKCHKLEILELKNNSIIDSKQLNSCNWKKIWSFKLTKLNLKGNICKDEIFRINHSINSVDFGKFLVQEILLILFSCLQSKSLRPLSF